jgi:hypothetical protein
MKQNYTHVEILLDRSGSMVAIKEATISGFNKFLKEQKVIPGEATIALTQFDDEYTPVYPVRPLHAAPELTAETYVPRNLTALLDAMGRRIVEAGVFLAGLPEHLRPSKVVFVVITDGHENASQTYTRKAVFELIEAQRKTYKWEFVFIGANQDAIKEGGAIGVAAANAMTFDANPIGTESVYSSLSSNMARYRAGTADTMAFSLAQRDAALEGKGGSNG